MRLWVAVKNVGWRHPLMYLGLSSVALTQPLFDLYGKNLSLFSTAKLSSAQIWTFLLAIAILPTLTCVFIEYVATVIHPRVGQWVFMILATGWLVVFGLVLTQQWNIEADFVAYLVTVLIAAVSTFLLIRYKQTQVFVQYLSVVGLISSVMFVNQLKPVLWPDKLSVEVNHGGVVAAKSVSTIFIIADEFPLYSLLDANGTINAERYPGIAELAGQSTWYRNATSVSQRTEQAVPAIMTGQIPKKGDTPYWSQHPKNILTLLSAAYPVDSYESLTVMCPKDMCNSVGSYSKSSQSSGSLSRFFSDAGVVFGHRLLPEATRSNLPSIDESWSGFGNGAETVDIEVGDMGEDVSTVDRLNESKLAGPLAHLNAMLSTPQAVVDSPTPIVEFAHVLLPHRAYKTTPDWRQYIAPAPIAKDLNPAEGEQPRIQYQRLLLQVGALDSGIGQLIRVLKSAGEWDSTLVVLMSDHGISFKPGVQQRATDFQDFEQLIDLYHVPMFIKAPMQSEPEINDCDVMTIDALPTVEELLGINSGWEYDGESLVDNCPKRPERPITTVRGSSTLVSSIADLQKRSDFYDTVAEREGPLSKAAGVGVFRGLVGQTIESNTSISGDASFTLDQIAEFDDVGSSFGDEIPIVLTGQLNVSAKLHQGTELVFTVDGVVAGASLATTTQLSGAIEYQALIDYSLLTAGKHSVEAFLVWGDTSDPRIAKVAIK